MKQLFSMTLTLLLLQICLTAVASGADNAAQKKRIKKRVAVFVFDDKTDQSYRWWNNKKVGEGISDMLITELVKTNKYRVIERSELDALLQEQNLSASGIVTSESAAQAGQVLGVELAVMGAVTEFGYTKSKTGGAVRGFGLGVSSQSATVGMDVRMVNTSTAEIVSAENVRSEKSAKGISVDTRRLDFSTQKQFDESLVGKAARDAVQDVIKMLGKQAPNMTWQAKVVMEKSGAVFINAGANCGIQTGDTFAVFRQGEELKDPDTGLSLGSIESKIGEIKVGNAQIGEGKAAQCTIVTGSGFQRGDLVRME
jgi:curli biogenesis system outer membrane secretion channel CsgG